MDALRVFEIESCDSRFRALRIEVGARHSRHLAKLHRNYQCLTL